MNKIFILGCVCLLFVGTVSAYSILWSNPPKQDGSSIEWKESNINNIKIDCQKDEWNNNFEDFREGLISKEDMKIYVRSCKW